jgi:hypothetical protein
VEAAMISSGDMIKLSIPGYHDITITYQTLIITVTLRFESNSLNQLLLEFYDSLEYSGSYQQWLNSVTGSSTIVITSAYYNEQNQLVVTLSTSDLVNLGTKPLPRYDVTFYGFGGSLLSTQYIRHGEAALAPNVPDIQDYTFIGWDVSFGVITKPTQINAIYSLGDQFQLDILMLSINRLQEADFSFNLGQVFQVAQNNPSPVVMSNRKLSSMFFPFRLDETEEEYYSDTNYIQHPYWKDYYFHKSMYQMPARYNDMYIFTSTLNSYNTHTLNSIYDVTTAMTNQAKDMAEWAIDHLTVMDTWVEYPNHKYLLQYDSIHDVVELYLIMEYEQTGTTSYRKVRIYNNEIGEEVIELWINEYFSIGTYPGTMSYYNIVGGKDFNSYTFWLDAEYKPIEDQFVFRGVNRNDMGGYDYYSNFTGMISGEYGWYPTTVDYDKNTKTTSIPSDPFFTIYTPDANSNVISIMGGPGLYHVHLYLPSMDGLLGLLFSENALIQENQDSEETRQMLIAEGYTPLPDQYLYNNSQVGGVAGILTSKGVFLDTDPIWNGQVRHSTTIISTDGEGKREYSNYHNYYGIMMISINSSSLQEAFLVLTAYLDHLGLTYKYGDTSKLLAEAVVFYDQASENTRKLIMIDRGSSFEGLPFENDTNSFALFHEYIKNILNFTPEMLDLIENRPLINASEMPQLPDRSRIVIIPIEEAITGQATISSGGIDASDIDFIIEPTVLLENGRQYQIVFAYRMGGKLSPFAVDVPMTYNRETFTFSLGSSFPVPQPMSPGEFQIVMFLAKITPTGLLRVSSIVPIPFEAFDDFQVSIDDSATQLSFDYWFYNRLGEALIESTFVDRFPPFIYYTDEADPFQNQGIIEFVDLPYGTTMQTWLESLSVWDFVDGWLPILADNLRFNGNPVESLLDLMLPGEYVISVQDGAGNSTTLTFEMISVLCTITFIDKENQEISQVILQYGTEIIFPLPPEVFGHTFMQWSISELNALDNFIMKAEYELNRHTITYYIDDEFYLTMDLVPYGEIIELPDVPRVGYTLVWTSIIDTMPDEDVIIHGQYEINRHTITYYIDDEIYLTMDLVPYGEIIELPDVPQVGYTLVWTPIIDTMPDEDVIIHGQYEINRHTITYYIDDEIYLTMDLVPYGEIIELPDVPQVGYTLVWTPIIDTMPDEDVIIHGQYEINRHTITYYIDDEIYLTMDLVPYGEIIELPDVPQVGYTLVWTSIIETMPDDDLTIYGVYELNHHSVFFYLNGTLYLTVEYGYGEVIVYPSVQQEGYVFSGWDSMTHETMPDNDVTINGTLTPIEE